VFEPDEVIGRRGKVSIAEELERTKVARPTGKTIEVATKTDEGVLEVHQVKRASIKNIAVAEPVFLTREEALQISILENEGKNLEAMQLYSDSIKHGPIYEDLSTGEQYHADELSFVTDEGYTADEVFGTKPKIKNPYDEPMPEPRTGVSGRKLNIKNPYDEPMPEPRASAPGRRLNIENPYDEPSMTIDQIKSTGRPAGMTNEDFDLLMKKITGRLSFSFQAVVRS